MKSRNDQLKKIERIVVKISREAEIDRYSTNRNTMFHTNLDEAIEKRDEELIQIPKESKCVIL